MVAGPFDPRKRSVRCLACSSSHLKCIGQVPCQNCLRRGKQCVLKVPDRTIKLQNGRHSLPRSDSRLVIVKSPRISLTEIYLGEFLISFLGQNDFAGQPDSLTQALKSDISSHAHESLISSVTAIGALQSSREHSKVKNSALREALKRYNAAVCAMRAQIATAQRDDLSGLLWPTFFLGIFELMIDDTGNGWAQHMLNGTGTILRLITPSECVCGPAKSFLRQVRSFEVFRAMIFVDHTFLAEVEWQKHLYALWSTNDATDEIPARERLLDLMSLIAELRVRSDKLFYPTDQSETPLAEIEASLRGFAVEGFGLRESLLDCQKESQRSLGAHDQSAFTQACYPALFIFLSGIFDYSHLWATYGIPTPRLGASEVVQHVEEILEACESAISSSNVAGILLLIPLRIAGARATDKSSRDRILVLLLEIQRSYRAATSIMIELKRVWSKMMIVN